MSVLGWGKPTIEYVKSENGTPGSEWSEFPEIVENTTQLETTEGQLIEAPEEGGDIVDSRRAKNKYKLSFELYVKKGDTKPIEDEDGVIVDNYAVRVTPEDPQCEGFVIDKANVSIVETFTSADGKRWRYTFDAIKPASGKVLKPYTKTTA